MIDTLLAQHQTRATVMGGWTRRNGIGSDRRYGWTCSCGDHSPDAFKVDLTREQADAGRFAHTAASLAPFLADLLTEARADVLREHADREMAHEGATMAVERLLAHTHEYDGHLRTPSEQTTSPTERPGGGG